MKVIENNFKPPVPEWPKQATCHSCKSILSVIESDFRYENYIFSQRERERVKVCTCPCCGEIIPISWANLKPLG